MFPEFATDIPTDDKLFMRRIKVMLNSPQSNAKYLLESKQRGELPINLNDVPLVNPHARLLYLQRM